MSDQDQNNSADTPENPRDNQEHSDPQIQLLRPVQDQGNQNTAEQKGNHHQESSEPDKESSETIRKENEFLQGLRNATFNIYNTNSVQQGNIVTGGQVGQTQATPGDFQRVVETQGKGNFRPIAESRVEKVMRVFVRHQLYQNAFQRITRERILILSGEKGWGKFATAIYLACEKSGADRVFQIPPTLRLKDIATLSFERRRCYILDGAPTTFSQGANQYELDQLVDALEEKQSFLIVTTHQTLPTTQIKLGRFTLPMVPLSMPERLDLLRTHINDHAIEDHIKDAAYALLQENSVQYVVQQNVGNDELAGFANELVRVAEGAISLPVAVERFRRLDAVELNKWLSQIETPADWAFLISLAVFNGEKTEYIEHAAELLRRSRPDVFRAEISSDEDEEDKKPKAPLPPRRASALYEMARCYPDYADDRKEVLVFENGINQYDVLGYYWKEYPMLRNPICDWLRMIGQTGSVNIESELLHNLQTGDFDSITREMVEYYKNQHLRVRAALAAGELVKLRNYDTIYNRIFDRWICTNRVIEQTMVGVALMPCIVEEDLAAFTLEVVDEWRHENNDSRHQRTAALAYGYVGVFYPPQALNNLGELMQIAPRYKRNSWRVFSAVHESIKSLFAYGRVDEIMYAHVLQTLTMWQTQDWGTGNDATDKELRAIAYNIFFDITSNEMEDVGDEEWPLMLLLARRSSEMRGVIVGQIRHALQQVGEYKNIQDTMLQILEAWCHFVDETPIAAATMSAIFNLVRERGDERDEKRLLFHIQRWALGRKGSRYAAWYLNQI